MGKQPTPFCALHPQFRDCVRKKQTCVVGVKISLAEGQDVIELTSNSSHKSLAAAPRTFRALQVPEAAASQAPFNCFNCCGKDAVHLSCTFQSLPMMHI